MATTVEAMKMDVDNTTTNEVDEQQQENVDIENIGDADLEEEDEDEESTTKTKQNNKAKNSNSKPSNSVLYSPELLQMYYSRLFPYGILHSWLSYGNNTQLFSRREFSMTIEPTPGNEVYIRYQSFPGEKELATAIMKRRPTKIDIGAIFSHPPKDHNTIQKSNFQPVQRELVFDIDLTDYDDVRKCGCSGASICGVCWNYMKMAVKVMDAGLKEDFGFQHVCWFYSGRRGVHAWVSDESARELTDQGRSAVANYFEVNLGTDKNKDVSLPHPLHPMLSRAYSVLEPMFIEQVIPASGHGLLASSDQWNNLLDSLPETADRVSDMVRKRWDTIESTPEEKWEDLKKHILVFLKTTAKAGTSSKAPKSMTTKERNRLETWHVEVVFRNTYPRLDVNVSKMRNHLLKSPFCVHPKTGRVCVPFQADKVDNFDPFQVPTLPQLMKELDEYEENNSDDDDNDNEKSENDKGKSNSKLEDWQKTSLRGYFEPFQTEFLPSLLKAVRRKERDEAEQQAAMTGDF